MGFEFSRKGSALENNRGISCDKGLMFGPSVHMHDLPASAMPMARPMPRAAQFRSPRELIESLPVSDAWLSGGQAIWRPTPA